jgi:DNA polymerase I-like protein with 3'-5' exonuclease and polymerase domains
LEYGGVYGGSDDTVWKSIVVDFPEVSLKMVSIAIKKMKIAVAGVLRWQQQLFESCSRPPYELRSYILGRRRVFPMGDPSPTDVNNNPNQFTGSDIMNIGMANMIPRLEKYRGRVFPTAQIHDAAYFECDDNDRQISSVGKDVTEAFTQVYASPSGIEIDFPIELKYGYAMNDKHDVLDAEFGFGRSGLQKLKL